MLCPRLPPITQVEMARVVVMGAPKGLGHRLRALRNADEVYVVGHEAVAEDAEF